jgi:IclR family mhp operon transcriptional activator
VKADQELRSLKRGLKVLSLLNRAEPVSITELARYLELPRTTAERILLTLVAEGYVERMPADRRYRLNSKVCTLADGFSDDCWIVQVATPLLFELTRRIGWPLAIATPADDHMVLRCTTDPATSLSLAPRRVGALIPMLNASSGLIAAACCPEEDQEAMLLQLERSADPVNRARAVDRRALSFLLQPVRENGFAFQPPPNNNPEQSIAFPIFVGGRYVASLLMIYMTRAMTAAAVIADYAPQLRVLAERIGEAAAAHQDVVDPGDFTFPRDWGASGRSLAAGS